MDWFVYDRDLRHERVKRVNPQNKIGCMREKLFPHTFLKQVTIHTYIEHYVHRCILMRYYDVNF